MIVQVCIGQSAGFNPLLGQQPVRVFCREVLYFDRAPISGKLMTYVDCPSCFAPATDVCRGCAFAFDHYAADPVTDADGHFSRH
jgi:hypothetical protein